jgi:putative ABC transport system substrate-binding protein
MRYPALATELVGRKVDVIVTGNGTPSALAAKSATSTIPIVFMRVTDPVRSGLVASLARPGGNLTGFGVFSEVPLEHLELLSELARHAPVIALLMNPTNPIAESTISDMQEAARAKGLQLTILKAASEDESDAAFATLVQLKAGGLVVGPDRLLINQTHQLVGLAFTACRSGGRS